MAQEIADSTLLDTWGSSGAKIEPDITKIIEGWQLGEQPPHEYMNWLQNTFGSKLNHILKNGGVKWNNETEYLADAIVQHSGNVWLCKTTNSNSEPTDVNSNWKRIITVEALTSLLAGYVALTGNQTIAGVKTFNSSPIVPTPTTGTQAANKDYVDDTSILNLSAKVDKARDASGDIDLVLTGGIYAYSSNLTNLPRGAGAAGAAGTLIVSQGINTSARSQLLISINGNMFFRYGDNEGWNSWEQLVSNSDFIQSLKTAGYQKLPSGLILQWGRNSGVNLGNNTVTFPVAFPNACLFAMSTPDENVSDSTRHPITNGKTTTTATFYIGNTEANSASYGPFSWLAIGN